MESALGLRSGEVEYGAEMDNEVEMCIYDAQKMQCRSVWYKVMCRDDKGREFFYPTSSIIYSMIRQDLQEHGPFIARVELESKSMYKQAHYSLSNLLRSYEVVSGAPNIDSYEETMYKKPSGS